MITVDGDKTAGAVPMDRKTLQDMQKLVKMLEDDLRVRAAEVQEAAERFRAETRTR